MDLLLLKTRRSAGLKRLEKLKRERGAATIDGDAARFVVLSTEIADTERDLASIDAARAEADEESRRRRAADEPRRRAEAHKHRLAEVEELEEMRLSAVAEAAARVLVDALTRAQAAAKRLDQTCPDTLVKEPNFSMRMSERLASALLRLTGGHAFYGNMSLAAAQHAHLSADHDWREGERLQFAGMLELLRRP